MAKIAIGLYGLQGLFGGDFASVIDAVRLADSKGVDQVSITDHVIMSENLHNYPYGPFPAPLDFPWYEPLIALSAIASVTNRINLSTSILIAPLRPAVLLAKQLATLDTISHGRVTIGLGLGWQKEEYDASGVPWEGRYARMDEQVKVCKQLWSEAPATFHGETVNYDRMYSLPFPEQKRGIPVWFGLAPTPKNVERIAEFGDGWVPMDSDPARVKEVVVRLRAAFDARGRDPAGLDVRVLLLPSYKPDGTADFKAMMAKVPPLLDAGATVFEILPSMFCRDPSDLDAFYERALTIKE
ncbi:MAG: fmn-dependent monooxygenase [Rhodospirillales bacterium]|nr:fmn-dependent monooxygenase [Rhodospirillales bacterium]